MDGKQFCYEKIQNYIISNIDHEKYPTGKIESEHQLCKLFSTSRMTVRQALNALQEEGYIYTVPKKGSFVSKKKSIKHLDGLRSFTEDMMGKSKSKVILYECIENPGVSMLSKKVWHIQRVRFFENHLIAYEEGYFNAEMIGILLPKVVEQSIYDYIENELGYTLDYAQQEISAVNNEVASQMMHVDAGTPLLKISQTTYTTDERCIEICDTYYTCEHYTFRQNAYRRK